MWLKQSSKGCLLNGWCMNLGQPHCARSRHTRPTDTERHLVFEQLWSEHEEKSYSPSEEMSAQWHRSQTKPPATFHPSARGAPRLHLHLHPSPLFSGFVPVFRPSIPRSFSEDLTFFPLGSHCVLTGGFCHTPPLVCDRTQCPPSLPPRTLTPSLTLSSVNLGSSIFLFRCSFPSFISFPLSSSSLTCQLAPSSPLFGQAAWAARFCFLWQLFELSLRACCSARVEHSH